MLYPELYSSKFLILKTVQSNSIISYCNKYNRVIAIHETVESSKNHKRDITLFN